LFVLYSSDRQTQSHKISHRQNIASLVQ